jgi:hypothetical protein
VLLTGLVVFLITFSGCYSYQRIAPAQAAAYGQIRVTYSSGSQESIESPHVAGDTLYGYRDYDHGPVSRPIDEIASIDARKINVTQSVLLGVVGGAALGFGILVGLIALTHD